LTLAACTESSLLDALGRGETVVLPNRRAARSLRRAFDQRQRSRGLHAWQAANVSAWQDWTSGLWSSLAVRGAELRLLLNAAQEHVLWRRIVEESTAGTTLSSPDALAEMARTAWATAAAHKATERIRPTANSSDARIFAGWAASFARMLNAEGYWPSAMLEQALEEHAIAGALDAVAPAMLVGFDEFTPAQAGLLRVLRESGCKLTETTLAPRATSARIRTIVATPRHELLFTARWIRQQFLEARDPAALKIAVLTSQPDEDGAEIDGVFRASLAPALEAVDRDLSAAPWEYVSGAPLVAQPMAADAAALLRLLHKPLPLERVGTLLRSPFVGQAEEQLAAARFDAQDLRRGQHLLPEMDLEGLRRALRRSQRAKKETPYNPAWIDRVSSVPAGNLRSSGSGSYGDWAEFMRRVLRAANWPGEHGLSANEAATLRAWDSSLDLLATLDFRSERVTYADALDRLERLLQTARVACASTADTHAAIEIMRPAEAEGSTFDAAILLHANDESWPEPARPHPLLSWQLQQELGLPAADAARSAEHSLARMRSLVSRSASVLAVSARADEQGAMRCSPMLAQLGLEHREPDTLAGPEPQDATVAAVVLRDDSVLPGLPSAALRGGSRVLKLQASCSFLAFAEMRLQAKAMESREFGLSALESGNLVHRALEHFWGATRSQAELRALSPQDRAQRIEEAVSAAFSQWPPPADSWSTAYLRVQRARLRRMISLWLAFELKRGPFTVQQQEDRQTIPIGPLQLDIRPDRIDVVDGGTVVVDYKTGHTAKPSQWKGERPDDPQLPLYTLSPKVDTLRGVLFARLRAGEEMRWDGLLADRAIAPERKLKVVDLEAQRDEWRAVLTALAKDFASGRADIDPRNFADDCSGCAQRALCRVDPEQIASSGTDDRGDEQEAHDG
jgi:probable DNA repair protein